MLVLGRCKGQEIMIGDSIRVTIVEVRGGRVRIGVEAPGEVDVRREEVVERRTCIPRAKKSLDRSCR